MVASDARIIHPSAFAAGRYQSTSIGLVRWRSEVDVTIKMGQRRAGSKPGGKVRTARPVSTRGLPLCAAMSWKYFGTGKRISTILPPCTCCPARVAAASPSGDKPNQINPDSRLSLENLVTQQSIVFRRDFQRRKSLFNVAGQTLCCSWGKRPIMPLVNENCYRAHPFSRAYPLWLRGTAIDIRRRI